LDLRRSRPSEYRFPDPSRRFALMASFLSSFAIGARATAETRGHDFSERYETNAPTRPTQHICCYIIIVLLARRSSKGFLVVFCARCNYTDETVELRDWYAIPSHASEEAERQLKTQQRFASHVGYRSVRVYACQRRQATLPWSREHPSRRFKAAPGDERTSSTNFDVRLHACPLGSIFTSATVKTDRWLIDADGNS
jgi:hypothetical protein